MLKRWKVTDPLLFWITCVVVSVHLLGLGFLAWRFPYKVDLSTKDKKLLVKTVKLHPPKKSEAPKESAVAEAPPPPPPRPPPPPPPKPKPKKKVVKKKEKPKTPPKEKAKAPPKEKPKEQPKKSKVDDKKKKLLQQAKEALAKIDQRTDDVKPQTKTSTKVPKRIENLSVVGVKSSEKNESSTQGAYRMELATHLRAQLQLPEMGDVAVKIVIGRRGRVENVVIVSSQSERNADYITKTLPTLKLPSFGDAFGGAKSHAFHITLTNE